MPDADERDDTRTRLARALQRQLATISLDRVTVSCLAREAGVTRQAFYYHFADVADLAVWTFQTEVADHILAHRTRAQWADGFLQLMSYMQDHADQSHAVLEALSHHELEGFFYRQLHVMMTSIVDEVLDGAGPIRRGDPHLTPHDRDFVIDHYTLTVLGHFMHWLAGDMRADPVDLVSDMEVVMDGAVGESIRRLTLRTGATPACRTRTDLRHM